MSSTLKQIMNEDTMAPSAPWSGKSPTSAPTPQVKASGNFWPWILLLVAVIVGLAIYFKPTIINFLSVPEKVIEEEVKREVDTTKKKFGQMEDEDFVKPREKVDKEGVLEENGYCYIGTDRGIRSCIDVNPGDKCMSGQIFPRRDICVNPNLRL